MNVQFKKGILEICVLVLLDKKDCYGYELVQRISDKITTSEESMNQLLRRLTKEGYYTTYFKESSSGPARKYYSLTKQGQMYLHDHMEDRKEFTKAVDELIEEGVSSE